MLAAAIVVSMQVLGVLMIAAAIVIPPIVARLLTNSFSRMAMLSTGIGIACAVLGLYLSYLIELSHAAKVSPGPSVVLFSSALFVLTLAMEPVTESPWTSAEASNNCPGNQALRVD